MKELYTADYLKSLLETLTDEIDDLHKWSIWNHDEKLEEIVQLEGLFELLKAQLTKKII